MEGAPLRPVSYVGGMKHEDLRHLPAGSLNAATVDSSEAFLATSPALRVTGDDPAALLGYPWGAPKPAKHQRWTARLLRTASAVPA